MTPFQAAARAYAARGWPVLPIVPDAKVPLTSHGLLDATCERDVIDEWWRRWPNANVGIRTGVAFDVLDVDGSEGITELGYLLGGGDASVVPDGPAVLTPSGGLHVYFAPTEFGNRARFRPGCDWRGNGGYVVAPPSVVGGVAYAWWPDTDARDAPIVRAPGWLRVLLDRATERVAPPPVVVSADSRRGARYADAALRGEVERVAHAPEGTRNHTLNAAAFSLGQLVGAGLLDEATVAALLIDAALASGLSEREARATVQRAISDGSTHPREVLGGNTADR